MISISQYHGLYPTFGNYGGTLCRDTESLACYAGLPRWCISITSNPLYARILIQNFVMAETVPYTGHGPCLCLNKREVRQGRTYMWGKAINAAKGDLTAYKQGSWSKIFGGLDMQRGK